MLVFVNIEHREPVEIIAELLDLRADVRRDVRSHTHILSDTCTPPLQVSTDRVLPSGWGCGVVLGKPIRRSRLPPNPRERCEQFLIYKYDVNYMMGEEISRQTRSTPSRERSTAGRLMAEKQTLIPRGRRVRASRRGDDQQSRARRILSLAIAIRLSETVRLVKFSRISGHSTNIDEESEPEPGPESITVNVTNPQLLRSVC